MSRLKAVVISLLVLVSIAAAAQPRRHPMTIPAGTTFYSDNANLGDIARFDSLTDYAADMGQLMSNLNFLETVAGYPLTTWADSSGVWSQFFTYRVNMTGADIPGGGLYFTDAINRVRVQLLGLSAISSWGFSPSGTTFHITARDNMQERLGTPLAERRVLAAGAAQIVHREVPPFPSPTISQEDLTTGYGQLYFAGSGSLWTHTWPLFRLQAPTDAGADSYFGYTLSRQMVMVEWAENTSPTLGATNIHIRLGSSDDLALTSGPFDSTAFWNNSTSTGVTYPNAPFTSIQKAFITSNVSAWLGGGYPAYDIVAYWSPGTFPYVGGGAGTWYNWTRALPIKIAFWGVDA